MCPKNPNRLSRLHQQRLVVRQSSQRLHNRMKTFPIPRRFSRSAVHHQIFRLLRHLRIQIVHQHPQRRFLLPPLAGNLRPPRRAKWPLRQSRFRHRPRHCPAHEFPSPPLILAHATLFCIRAPRSSLLAYFASRRILTGASLATPCHVFPPNAIDKWFLPLHNAIVATKLTLDKAGRVVLPKPLRDRLQLAPGDTLDLESEGERITLRPVRQNVMLKKELGVWVYQGEPTDASRSEERRVGKE